MLFIFTGSIFFLPLATKSSRGGTPQLGTHTSTPMKVHGHPPLRLDSSSIHEVSLMSKGSEAIGDVGFWLTEEEVMDDKLAHLEIELE